ncbi:hypothetical protein GUITHDRAFT_117326 [Guillardia theta CCMP2712]|uniref:Myb-like domain-containing protein n=1 Tax=Guillardia theta (strain CCMP2712) TaxID=905079 RepID=L1IL70_GUITC|nr:hypothetical protein GUITHDRAFT_117326 [Guillardia theta CCMP2712]EKX36545.1 hypothetical protein GUITHDRAFT_117326 [Guillardia theta CCMP2712]|eukprot:XP_005823525.1 hypothetical protein GUITHDRAFT_117326 [Guillardia theta CCMP2712]
MSLLHPIAHQWKASLPPTPMYDHTLQSQTPFHLDTQSSLQYFPYQSQSSHPPTAFPPYPPYSHIYARPQQPQDAIHDAPPACYNPAPSYSSFHQDFPVPPVHKQTVIHAASHLAGLSAPMDAPPLPTSSQHASNAGYDRPPCYDVPGPSRLHPSIAPPRPPASQSVDSAVAALWPEYQEPGQSYLTPSDPSGGQGAAGLYSTTTQRAREQQQQRDKTSLDACMDDPFRADFQQTILSATEMAGSGQLTDSSSSAESDGNEGARADAAGGAGGRKQKKRGEKGSAAGHSRHWKEEEHETFLMALKKLSPETLASDSGGLGPGIAELIAAVVKTRTVSQVRSHAQKFLIRWRKQREGPGQGK